MMVVGGYAAYKYGSPLVSHYQLKSATEQIAKYSAAGVLSESEFSAGESKEPIQSIKEAVLMEAKMLGIPLRRQDISVKKADGQFVITVRYTVPIDLWHLVYNLLPIQMPDLTLSFTEHN
jgi:hypothetical protein